MILARLLFSGAALLTIAWALLLGVVVRDPSLLTGGDPSAVEVEPLLREIDELRSEIATLRASPAEPPSPPAEDEDDALLIAAGAPPDAPAAAAEAPPQAAADPETRAAVMPEPADEEFLLFEPRVHRVVQGDSMFAIAERYGTTVEELVALNGIRDPEQIRVGTVLILP